MTHTADRPLRVAVLASGGGTNLQALLEACTASQPARVVLVASDRPHAGALARARQAGIATHHLTHPADGAALVRLLEEHRTDLVVLAGYLKLVPTEAVRAYAARMINIHPALLPSFGGPGMYGHRVHRAVLESGAAVSGATVHLVDSEYDRGPILAQWPVAVHPGDTPETLAARVLEVEHRLLPAVVLAGARAGKIVALVPGKDFGMPELMTARGLDGA